MSEFQLPEAAEVRLLKCWVTGEAAPHTPERRAIYFTNQFLAGRFLEKKYPLATEFHAETIDIFSWSQTSSFCVNPCAECGFSQELAFDPQEPQKSFEALRAELGAQLFRHNAYYDSANEAALKKRYEDAMDLIQVLAQHLDASDPRVHYLAGVCGHHLNNSEIWQGAVESLKVLSPEFLARLQEYRTTSAP